MRFALATLGIFACTVASAAVTPVDLNNDGFANGFFDSTTGSVWSNANIYGQANWFDAKNIATSATMEELKWRLPTLSEFQSLYATQGHSSAGHMIASPFTDVQNSWYWTSDVDPTNALRAFAYSPSNNAGQAYFQNLSPVPAIGRTSPYVWLISATVPESVATVSEPPAVLLVASSLLLIWLGFGMKRQAKPAIAEFLKKRAVK
jgi:hypothetical protein